MFKVEYKFESGATLSIMMPNSISISMVKSEATKIANHFRMVVQTITISLEYGRKKVLVAEKEHGRWIDYEE